MILKFVPHTVKWLLIGVVTWMIIAACNVETLNTLPVRSDAQKSISSTSATRVIQHDMGRTMVPVHPQRVVTLDTGHLANALALGIQPIGSTAWYRTEYQSGLSPVEPYLNKRSQELTILGYGFSSDQVSLEKLLTLQPDLVMAVTPHKAIYDQLSQIAPTVLYDYPSGDGWKDFLRLSSAALGKQEQAETLLRNYHRRVEEFKQKMGSRLSIRVSVIHPLKEGTRIMYKGFFGGSIIQATGLARPPEQNQDGTNSQPVSLEWIPKMEGDVILVISFKDKESLNLVDQMKEHPLWSQLEAVKQGKVYLVDAEHWYGGDIVTANLVLDDLFKYLLEEE